MLAVSAGRQRRVSLPSNVLMWFSSRRCGPEERCVSPGLDLELALSQAGLELRDPSVSSD